MKKNTFVTGALILIVFNLIGKVLGAVYRIPLAKIIGSVGMGLYQLTFPLYTLILTVVTSGITVAVSKMVSGFNAKQRLKDSRRIFWISLLYLAILSFAGALLIVFCAKFIASLQGNSEAFVCYYAIAPAIVFVGVLSAFRGYFQGNLMMFPTAISGLVEQISKLVVGLFLAQKLLVYGAEYAVVGALIGVSISEFFACLFLAVCYVFYSKKHKINGLEEKTKFKFLSKQMFSLAVPVTVGGLVSPITNMIDSILVVNLLIFTGLTSSDATMLLGLQSGVVEPLVNLPVIISVAIATALLPSISGCLENGEHNKIKTLIERAYQITMSISIACFICFVVFGEQILSFLYGSSFDFYELATSVKLLFLGGVNIMVLSLVQVSSSVLQALGKAKESVRFLLAGCFVKIALYVALISIKPLNIYGAIISGGVCYLVVLSMQYKLIKKLTGANMFSSYFYISIQASIISIFAYFSNSFFRIIFAKNIAMFFGGFLAVAVFLITYYIFFMKKEKESNVALEKN